MTKIQTFGFILAGICTFALFSFFVYSNNVEANIQNDTAGYVNSWQEYNFFHSSSTNDNLFGATTTNATSTGTTFTDSNGRIDNGYFVLKGAEAATMYFTRYGASDSEATSTFNIQVSMDGTTWIDYNKMISNVTNSNSQELTRVSSVTIVGATSTVMTSLDLNQDAPYAVRCIATIGDDGSNECRATAKY